jgi:hypothetical protein
MRRRTQGQRTSLTVPCRGQLEGRASLRAGAPALSATSRFLRAGAGYRRLVARSDLVGADTMRLGRTDSSGAAIRDAFLLAGTDSSRQAWTWLMRCGLWSRLGQSQQAIEDCARAAAGQRIGDGALRARSLPVRHDLLAARPLPPLGRGVGAGAGPGTALRQLASPAGGCAQQHGRGVRGGRKTHRGGSGL